MANKKSEPRRVNIIFGEESFRREEEIRKLSCFVASLGTSDEVHINVSDQGVQEALGEALTGSLFYGARHIVLRNAEELKAADARKMLETLATGDACLLPEGTFVTISWAERKFPPPGAKMPKIAGWAGVIECKKAYEKEARGFLARYAGDLGLQLTTDAADAMLSRLGTDLSLLAAEVDKLITYLGPGMTRATGEDVRKAVGEAAHEGLSALAETVIHGRSAQAMRLVRQFRESSSPKIPNQLMLAALASELRLMIMMMEKLSKGLSVQDAARAVKQEKELRTPDFLMERSVNAAARLGPGKAMRMLIRLGEADRQMKGGCGLEDTVIGEDQAFDAAVLELCAIAKGVA